MNFKWTVSNVTASGYDVLIEMSMDDWSLNSQDHYNNTDAPMFGAYNMYVTGDWLNTAYPGVSVSDTTITTPLGDKAVRHYTATIEDEDDSSLVDQVDIYVGKSNGVLYKWVTVEKENGVAITTITFEVFDSNIAMIGSNPNNDDDGDHGTEGTSTVLIEDGIITITGTGSAVTSEFDLSAGVGLRRDVLPRRGDDELHHGATQQRCGQLRSGRQ